MTDPLKWSSEEMSVLRWGGAAGMLGSLSLLAVFGFLAALVGLETLSVEAEMQRYPDIRTARVVENAMYLAAIALWAVHAVALSVVLRSGGFGPALAGGALMGLGFAVLAAGAIPHTMTDPVATAFHAPGVSAAERAALVADWRAIQGIVDTLVITGVSLAAPGMALLGLTMRRVPGFGSWLGWMSAGLAAAGIASAAISLIAPSDIIALGVFALIFFHLIVGWRTFRLAA